MKIKIAFVFMLIAFCALAVSGQSGTVVSDFEKNKAKYKLEKFAEGEDASSGYDYLFYKSKTEIVKVRVVWSSSANPNYWIEDYYFNNSKLTAFYRYDLAKRNYRSAKLGRTIPLKEVERMLLTDGKLTAWIVNSKAVSKDDVLWREREKEVLENANSKLELYREFKEEN